jgi:phosphoglycolate phosphatase
MNKKPKAIIFDWDNTLVDTMPVIMIAVNAMMQGMGREPLNLEQVKNDIHKSARDALPSMFGNRWNEAAELYQSSYIEHRYEHLKLLPGAMEVISFLFKQSIYLAIISNKVGDTLREEVEYLGLSKYFNKIIGSLDAAKDKPSNHTVTLALDNSSISPGLDVWFIGDTIIDVECAVNSGCRPIIFGDVMIDEEDVNINVKRINNHHELLTSLKLFLPN